MFYTAAAGKIKKFMTRYISQLLASSPEQDAITPLPSGNTAQGMQGKKRKRAEGTKKVEAGRYFPPRERHHQNNAQSIEKKPETPKKQQVENEGSLEPGSISGASGDVMGGHTDEFRTLPPRIRGTPLNSASIQRQTANAILQEQLSKQTAATEESVPQGKVVKGGDNGYFQQLEETVYTGNFAGAKDVRGAGDHCDRARVGANYERQVIEARARELEERNERELENWKYIRREAAAEWQAKTAQLTGQLGDQRHEIHTLQKQHAKDQEHIKSLENEIDKLGRKLRGVESTLSQQNLSVKKMHEKIVELTSRRTLAEPRDDNYFATQFNTLRINMTQWANSYYRTKDNILVKELPENLRQFLLKAARYPEKVFSSSKTSRARAQIVCGVVQHIFLGCEKPLLGVASQSEMIQNLQNYIGGIGKDRQHWYSVTTTLALRSPQFKGQQSEGLRAMTTEAQTMLAPLADKNMSSEELWNTLLTIFTEFARIFLEMAQQETIIRLNTVGCYNQQGEPVLFNPYRMEDIEGLEEDEELVRRGAMVNIVEFPGLLRVSFDDHGNVTGETLISKIRVSCKQ